MPRAWGDRPGVCALYCLVLRWDGEPDADKYNPQRSSPGKTEFAKGINIQECFLRQLRVFVPKNRLVVTLGLGLRNGNK